MTLDKHAIREILEIASTLHFKRKSMTPEQLSRLESVLQDGLDTQRREIDGALHRLADRIEQRARRQAQMFAQLHFGKGQVPGEVTDLISRIWLD